jgi:predicted Rdx family selenoprotein
MPFTVADFHDLVRLLEAHPDWRTELRRVLFSQDLLDLPRTVQELAIAQCRTEEAITHLTERLEQGFAEAGEDRQRIRERVEEGFIEASSERRELRQDLTHLDQRVEQGFAEAAEDRQRIRERVEQGFADAASERRDMRQDIGQLKGLGKEQFYRDRATAIFGRLLAQGHDATNQVADHLPKKARRPGVICDRDYQEALAADLLWSGQIRDSRQAIVLVLEASWTVDSSDIERASRRAAVLRQAGLKALPATAGQEWPPNMQDAARRAGVVILQDRRVDQESWEAALSAS